MATNNALLMKLDSTSLLHRTMEEYFQRLRMASESGTKKIAWCSSVGPAELLTAMGFEVYFPENHAAMIGASKSAAEFIPRAVAIGYSPDICSYLKSDIGAFLSRKTPLSRYGFATPPKPDVLVCSTNQCRETEDWFAFYARHFHAPLECIRAPSTVDELTPEIIEYVSKQHQALVPRLEGISGCAFDLDRFKEVVGLSREACALWRQVLETARHKPSPIHFFDASVHMGPVVVMRGTRPPIDYYRTLLAELEGRIAKGIGAVRAERFRLCWDGMPLWFRLRGMAELFARLSTCIVASTYCNSWALDDLDPDDPFRSSAQAYARIFIARTERVKEEMLAKLLADYAVDGILYHDAKTCPRNSNTRFGLPGRLHERTGIPFLEIQGDLNDSRCFSEEQAVMAIETFIGQIGMRR